MSLARHPERGLPGWIFDRSTLDNTSGAVEYVKARYPALIATLVAIAHAVDDDRGREHDAGKSAPMSRDRP